MASILFVSKPVVPPWNDSGKNLVRDLACNLTRYRAQVMVRAGERAELGRCSLAPIYAAHSGGFAPGLTDQARVFAHMLGSRGHDAWHFFFAPNPRSCLAGRAATRMRRVPSIHTLSSAPRDPRAIVNQLFADTNVVLSQHTERQLREAGLAADRLCRIAPAIEPLTPLSPQERAYARASFQLGMADPVIVYPGDLEFGEGATLMVEALRERALTGATLVMACRAKTVRAQAAEAALHERVRTLGLHDRVRFLGETPHIHALLGCADVVALPSTDLYAKMDYPLVLLEAMSLSVPVIVAQGSPAAELCEGDAARAVAASAEALAASLAALLQDSVERRALGERGRAAVQARYTGASMAAHYERAYDQLLGRRAG